MNLTKAIMNFTTSDKFVDGVKSSTLAGFRGGQYVVEFFTVEDYRVIWSGQVGNQYQTTGKIVSIPVLSEEQMAEVNEDDGINMEDIIKFYTDELVDEMMLSALR